MNVAFARVLVELPNGKVKEFRASEGKLSVVRTAPSGTPSATPASIHYLTFVASIEEGEL